MKHHTLYFYVFLWALVSPSLFAEGYSNPVIAGFHPDPSVCRVGDDYYLVTSSFEYFPGVPLFHSKDLIHWGKIGHCLTRRSQLDLTACRVSGGIYAPTIRYHQGRFYMITTNITGKGNFLVHTTDPYSDWSEPVWLAQKGIDPSLFWEGDTCYMVSNPQDEIMLCQINPLTGEQLTPSRQIWSGTGGRFPEAPHLYKKDGWYYLLLSEGGTQYGHKATIARSRKIEGPYQSNPANPIITHADNITKRHPIQGVGHADLIEAHDGTWWAVALGFRPVVYRHHILGRETYLMPVCWPKGAWPVVNGNGTVDLEMKVATLAQSSVPDKAARDDFESSALDVEWNFLRNPDSAHYSLVDRSGFLRLYGSPVGLDQLASPTFMGRRQVNAHCTIRTKLDFPTRLQDFEAGLTVFMNDKHHYNLEVRTSPAGRTIALSHHVGMLQGDVIQKPFASNHVYLQVVATPTDYTFYYSTDNRHYTELGKLDTRYLSSETAGGFTGVYFALYAISSASRSYVDVDWWECK